MAKGTLIALTLTGAFAAQAAEPYVYYLGTELVRSELEQNKLSGTIL